MQDNLIANVSKKAASDPEIDGGANLQDISFSTLSLRPTIEVRRRIDNMSTLNFHQLARFKGKLRDLTNILQRRLQLVRSCSIFPHVVSTAWEWARPIE